MDDEDEAAAWMAEQLLACPPRSVGEDGYAHATLYTRWVLLREPHKAAWS
ncbi:hypothetical protein [Streptomyces antarcticus]|nr:MULTISPECIES: hypothetical protein [unclassified Streptomyces]MCY0942214.1 hypothetical protein [Streptomyces sp. H34-AA3]MCZ4083194.1 hypothetical protein [Streptomyces sp. H34-S5]